MKSVTFCRGNSRGKVKQRHLPFTKLGQTIAARYRGFLSKRSDEIASRVTRMPHGLTADQTMIAICYAIQQHEPWRNKIVGCDLRDAWGPRCIAVTADERYLNVEVVKRPSVRLDRGRPES
jgi:hypothetical protein